MLKLRRMLDSRVTLALGAWVVYAWAFIPLYRMLGPMVLMTATVPVMISGWFFGMWVGLLAGLLAFPLHVLLTTLAREAIWEVMIRGLPGSVILLLVGFVVGRLHDLGEQVKSELTERKQVEREIEERRLYLEGVLRAVPDAIVTSDAHHRIVEWNPGAERLFGYSPQEASGQNIDDLITNPDTLEEAVGFRDIIMGGKELPPLETVRYRKDGSPVEVLLAASPILVGEELIGTVAVYTDITERKRAEEALAYERDLLHALLDNVPDAIYFKDTDSRFIRINRAHAERWFGLSDPAQAIGKTDFDFFSKEHAQKAYMDEQDIIRTGRPLIDMEERETWPDRPDTWVSTTKMPLRDAEGRIIGTFGLTRDITERKRAQEALAEERNLLRTLIDNMPDYIFVKDTESRFVINNRAHVRVLKATTQEEVLGKTDFDMFPQELAAQYYADEQEVIRSGQPLINREEPVVDQAGNRRWLSTTKVPLRDSHDRRIVGLVGVSRDITDRVQAERELEERRMYLEGVLGAAPDAIVTLDARYRIVEWNAGAERLFGYSREEVVGQNIDDLVTGPEVLEEAVGFTQTVMDGGEVPSIETLRYRQDGSPVDVIVAGSPILVEDELIGLVAVYTDITERKRAEEQLERYAAELEQANEEVKQFAYIVSHDLRAPLVNLKGFSSELRCALEVVEPAMDTALPHLAENQQRAVTFALQEDIPEALSFIDSSVTRMDRFISALLKLSRLGRRELHLETVDMETLAQATLRTLAHQIEERQVKVTVGPLPEVVADRTSMEQIMGNILGNAVKYLEPDRPGEIEITAERGDDETTFRIRDNGRGIAAEDMPKVFAPFRRAGRQDVPGEGMGLAYVQALVRRHDGRIWCESELGVGTTFIFTLSNHLKEGGSYA